MISLIILGMCAGYGVRWTAKGNLGTDASVSFLVIHISTLVFLSQLITFQQLFPITPRPTQLHSFEDMAEVTQMMMKGRSPTFRHVTRTHRVDLDWLCERII